MKKFALKIFLMLFLTSSWMIFVLLVICPQYTHAYTASFLDKMKRLESIKEPKLVLISNSNLAYGIQSELLEKELNMPIVNMGFHGGLGNAFHERMPLFNLTEGDIIVISHLEYSDDNTFLDPTLALLTLENHFHYWKILRLKDFPAVLSSLQEYCYKCFNRFRNHEDKEPSPPTCYARSAFNEYGDNIFPRNIEAGESAPFLRHPKVNDICMNRINKLYKHCKSKGVTVVLSTAPILSGLEGFNLDEYVQFQKEVESRAECPVISDFTDYVYDKKYFYSGAYHLTNDGAKLRTEQLIKDLKKFLETK